MDYEVEPAREPVRGAFRVPPSKSHHQRALVLAALADGPSELRAAGQEAGDDVRRLEAALGRIGRWCGGSLGSTRERLTLDLGRGATGLRFAVAAATLRPEGAATLVRGHPSLLARPHTPLLRALRRLGGHVKRRRSGSLRVRGGGVRGAPLALPALTSSQYASALLLIGPRIGGLEITLLNRPVSTPYLRATLDVLDAFGVPAQAEGLSGPGGRLVVSAVPPRGTCYDVPPDASSAAAWWAAAALTAGDVVVPGLSRGSPQADVQLLGILEAMGCRVAETPEGARVQGCGLPLRAPEALDLRDAPDLLPLVGVLAACAAGTTRVRGVAHARRKETDRVGTVARGLLALGGRVDVEGDDLAIQGGALRGGVVEVREDHRLAFAFGVLGLVVPGVVLRGAESAGKSHPAFLEDLRRAGGQAALDG